MIDDAKVDKMLNMCLNYAAEGHYLASDRQWYVCMELFIRALATDEDLTENRIRQYRSMAQKIVKS